MRTRSIKRWILAALVAPLIPLPAGAALAADNHDGTVVVVASRRSGPCQVTVRRSDMFHAVEITGLEPDEQFDLVLTYEGRKLVLPIVVARKGVVLVTLESLVRGESIGVGYVDFESSRCRVHLSYPWRSKT